MSFLRGLGNVFRAVSDGRNTASAHKMAEQLLGTKLPADVAQDAYGFVSRMADCSTVEQMGMEYVSVYAKRMVRYLDEINATEEFRLQVARNVARACIYFADRQRSGTDFGSFGLNRLVNAAQELGVETDSPGISLKPSF